MISHLYIENYTLIPKLDISFENGFSVITGETGAGKSILLGALGLILGERADTTALFDKNNKCIVEGIFELQSSAFQKFFEDNDLDFDQQCIIRREVNSAGKSRAFINDTPVNLNILKTLGERLVDIHSQHENLMLKEAGFQLNVIDHYAKNQEILIQYYSAYGELTRMNQEYEKLAEMEKQSRIDEDYYRFQLTELIQARLEEGESSRLESDHLLFSHSEEIKTALNRIINLFHNAEPSILDQLNEARGILDAFQAYSPELEEVVRRIESGFIELKDIGSELEHIESKINYDPEKLENIRQRLDLLYSLQKKHRLGNPDELIGLQEEIETKLDGIQHLSESLAKLQSDIQLQIVTVEKLAKQLHEKRNSVANEFSGRIKGILHRLGIPEATFTAVIESLPAPGPNGSDRVQFLFNANKGGEAGEISKIASGGELSRIMLTLKSVVSGKMLLPTIIFDEIDMGVSGKTADMVGNILNEMSSGKQLIVITHLPQIASKGTYHYFVYKKADENLTKTNIRLLDDEERVLEIARLISGENISPSAKETARELLANN